MTNADVAITMGCGDACPVFPGRRYLDWTLDDPDGLDVAAVRPSATRSNAASGPCSTRWTWPSVPDTPAAAPDRHATCAR